MKPADVSRETLLKAPTAEKQPERTTLNARLDRALMRLLSAQTTLEKVGACDEYAALWRLRNGRGSD